ncbi:hypothetical protein [Coleofasciculus sp. F4-SAH-05]|uniref:hypothetical protein n=1 Tax=Coleofasciculus sp. F4-SAH-05 TaxID=3069525 RepID=UPI0033029B1E
MAWYDRLWLDAIEPNLDGLAFAAACELVRQLCTTQAHTGGKSTREFSDLP